MSEKKSWRDVYKVHPAADLFPMLPNDELRALVVDINENGLRDPIILWSPRGEWEEEYLLDGRNRLAAMEWLDVEVSQVSRKIVRAIDPYTYVISKNIHRRHLTKEQQADLIVKAMKLKETDLAKMAKSVKQDSSGRLQGSTKNPIKQAAVEEGQKHGISQRTIERSIAKAKGPTQSPRDKKPAPKPEEQTGAWSMKKTLDRLRSGEKLSRSQLERENTFLLEKIADLQGELTKAKTDLLLEQMKQVQNYFRPGLQAMDMDLKTWRKYLSKKYHPDRNPDKTFTADEVMKDINPLLDGIKREQTGV